MKIEEWLGSENKLGQDIWYKKYQYNDESFEDWLNRITNNNESYKELIRSKKFLPGGRILANRGLYKDGVKVTYSNCYVIPAPEDNIESIFDTAKYMARTFSYGGGVGIDISKLAPCGAKVNNTAKHTSGAVSFMDLYSMVTGLIGQNGRRGALMISLNCDHPDVEKFIEIKSDLDKITKANISVKVTSKFMEAVKKDQDFKLTFARESSGEVIEKVIKAKELFEKLCYMNWDYAEPGILFWDRISNWNLLSNNPDFHYDGVNPCAEEPLPAGGSCCLGSINLAQFIKLDSTINENIFDYDEFSQAVKTSTNFMNEILDEGLDLHPLEIQHQTVRDWRQIGIGIMGLADCLIKLGLTYGSPEAVEFCDKLGFTMMDSALYQSALIAKEKGAYPQYNAKVLTTSFIKANSTPETRKLIKEYGLRNSQLLTCAPTGTLSTMLGISGGIEPIFANYYTRRTVSLHGHEETYKVYTPIVKEYMLTHELDDDSQLPEFFVESADILPENRIRMQAIWQKHIDASISSTINLPKTATVEDVKTIYMQAYEQGLKGVTVYRAGCKREAILSTETTKEPTTVDNIDLDNNKLPWGTVIGVNSDLIGIKTKLTNGCGSFHFQVFFDENTGRPWETFINLGDGAGCERNLEAISRLISKCLRAGVPVEQVIETLKSIRPCPAYCRRHDKCGDTSKGSSCPNSIGFALENALLKIKQLQVNESPSEETKPVVAPAAPVKVVKTNSGVKCPECGGELTQEGGCNVCKECGYSKCG